MACCVDSPALCRKCLRMAKTLATGAVVGGSTRCGFNGPAALSDEDDVHVGDVVVFTSGALRGRARRLTAYVGPIRRLAFANPLLEPLPVGTEFMLFRVD